MYGLAVLGFSGFGLIRFELGLRLVFVFYGVSKRTVCQYKIVILILAMNIRSTQFRKAKLGTEIFHTSQSSREK